MGDETGMAIRILISYRRLDSAAMTGRIYDRLSQRFGRKSVFLDVDSIPFGTDFRTHIDSEMRLSRLLVAVIGTDWTGRRDSTAGGRILDDDDPIRVEIASALKLKVPIIPVLVNGATMPAAAALPEDIRPLSYLNAIEIQPGRDFHPHVNRLIEAIERVAFPSRWARWLEPVSRRIWAGAAVAIVSFGAVAVMRGSDIVGRRRAPTAAPAADFCATLKDVVASTSTGFADLRVGSPTDQPTKGQLVLPGYEQCSVQKLSDVAYSCQSPETRDKAAADDALKQAANKAKTCLGGGWVGPAPLNGALSFSRAETGDSIIFMTSKMSDPAGVLTYTPTVIVYRHQEAAEPVADATVPEDFCPNLMKVVAAAAKGFEEIKGYDRGGYWMATVGLNGFERCEITPLSEAPQRRYYSCRLNPFASETSAKAALDELAETTAHCLPDGWSKEKDTDYHRRPRWTFHDTAAPLEVELRIGTSLNVWSAHLDVQPD